MLIRRQNRYRLTGYLFAISATALWSGNFIIARGLSETIPPVSLAFYRWVVAVIVFLPFALKPLLREWDCLMAHLPYLSMTALLGVPAEHFHPGARFSIALFYLGIGKSPFYRV